MAHSSSDVMRARGSLREEMAKGDLGDARLNARRNRLITVLEQSPDAGFPEACGSDSETEALYRFLRNGRVSLAAIIDDGGARVKQLCCVLEGDGGDGVRHGEDDVEILGVQDLGGATLDPRGTRQRLTLRTVPIPAGVLGDALVPTGVARFDMAAQGLVAERPAQSGHRLHEAVVRHCSIVPSGFGERHLGHDFAGPGHEEDEDVHLFFGKEHRFSSAVECSARRIELEWTETVNSLCRTHVSTPDYRVAASAGDA